MTLLTAAEQRRRSAIRRVVVAVGALVVVAAPSVAVTLLVVEGGEPQPRSTTPGVSPSTSEPTREYAEAGTWQLRTVSAGPLILPPPSGSEQGIPAGFRQTTEGAISAAAHYAEASVGLHPATAGSLAEVAAAPSYVDAAEDFVQAVDIAREGLGVTAKNGTNGAYLTFQAQAYRVSDATPDRVVVAVLGRGEGAGPATSGQGRTVYNATSYTLVWVDGDWHIAADGEPLSESVPPPRSPRAYEEGWRDLALA